MKSLIEPKRTNTILYCRNWQATVDFYRDQLGLPVVFANDWFVEFELTSTSFLSIANAARATIEAVHGQGITLTWQVDDVAASKARLAAQGIATTPIQHKWQAQVCYCTDPEGHRLELWAPEPTN
ncbi:MAG: VOC family protein [Anaerolineaceae bacterium]|nr:VOC family protein [Anaerolineaceae bacterium]